MTVAVNLADNLAQAGFERLARLYANDAAPSGVRRISRELPDAPSDDFDVLVVARPLAEELLPLVGDGGGVLLHCVSGVNRSATLLLCLLMLRHHCTLRAAMAWAARCRPIVHPCSVYQRQLLKLEDELRASRTEPLFDGDLALLDSVHVGTATALRSGPLPKNASQGQLVRQGAEEVDFFCRTRCVMA